MEPAHGDLSQGVVWGHAAGALRRPALSAPSTASLAWGVACVAWDVPWGAA
jgi:hypothetical protein